MSIVKVDMNRPTKCGGLYREYGYTVKVRNKARFFSITKYGEELAWKKAKITEEQMLSDLINEGNPLRHKSQEGSIKGISIVFNKRYGTFCCVIRVPNNEGVMTRTQVSIERNKDWYKQVFKIYKEKLKLIRTTPVKYNNRCVCFGIELKNMLALKKVEQ